MVTRPLDPDDDFPFSEPGEPGDAPPGRSPGDEARAARSAAGDAAEGEDGEGRPEDGDPWERVREAAWRVGQRARRHERVLHTRISQDLARDLRRAADDLRVPVSNLVRNVLEEAFGAVERVSDEVGGFLEEVLTESDGARDDLRRLRRQVRRLARRGRRRAFYGPGSPDEDEAAFADEEARGEDEDATERGARASRRAAAPAAAPAAAASPRERAEAALREAGAQEHVFRPRGAELPFPEVLGWQPLRLNAAETCACGERRLAAGEEAFAAITERGFSRTFLCGTCMRARGGG